MPIEYVFDHARLSVVTLGNLGKMAPGTTFEAFMARAREIASVAGVHNPVLILALKYKPDCKDLEVNIDTGDAEVVYTEGRGGKESVYLIHDYEWEDFITDAPLYLAVQPDVHVVDGNKYTTIR